jgi:pyruvate dehydrogenase E1 component alpha subunit
MRRLEI